MNDIKLCPAQGLYEIHHGEAVSFFGFDQARDNVLHIAERLPQAGITWVPNDHGAVTGYEKYRQAIAAWGESTLTTTTYFGPGTDPQVAQVLEACRASGQTVRLILGQTDTGRPWFCEYDVVGSIGRSVGPLRVPLLIEAGEAGGTAILCDSLLAVVDWATGSFLYRHPNYQAPELSIDRLGEGELWEVRHGTEALAVFGDVGQAGCYAAFMRGMPVDPALFAVPMRGVGGNACAAGRLA